MVCSNSNNLKAMEKKRMLKVKEYNVRKDIKTKKCLLHNILICVHSKQDYFYYQRSIQENKTFSFPEICNWLKNTFSKAIKLVKKYTLALLHSVC